ncbi:MAG TPA: L-fucose/L-arabinose isomerase family protein [Firmicutes bacterium]|nr:L-fucose/L-arabinose isomerase family protein [Bacillota bacterium]
MKHPLSRQRAKIGLYTVGLQAYWDQFPGLRERLLHYGGFIAKKLEETCDVCYFGLVDDPASGRAAGEYFAQKGVDLLFLHAGTYCTSASALPVHQACGAPVVILNLQPTAAMAYDVTGTGEWLANCGACPVPEFTCALGRCGIKAATVSGLLGMEASSAGAAADENTAQHPAARRAWQEIGEYVQAAAVKRNLTGARFGFLGGNYAGMLDLYSDFTQLQDGFKIHIEPLEMCDLHACMEGASEEDVRNKLAEIESFFQMPAADAADPIVARPEGEELAWTARVACGEQALVESRGLSALTYYYHGAGGNLYERMGAGLIVGNSLLTAAGVPCAGEGDMKTAAAMKICDLLDAGGSFSEIVAADYNRDTIIMGHDGPFHIRIAAEKPLLRSMRLYHGKRGAGVSVEAQVRPGPVTLFGVTQTAAGRLKCIISEAEAIDAPTLQIGNTQTHIRFPMDVDTYYSRLFAEAPTHHCAMGVGHIASLLEKTAELLGIDWVRIC